MLSCFRNYAAQHKPVLHETFEFAVHHPITIKRITSTTFLGNWLYRERGGEERTYAHAHTLQLGYSDILYSDKLVIVTVL